MKKNDQTPRYQLQALVWGTVAVLSTFAMCTQLL